MVAPASITLDLQQVQGISAYKDRLGYSGRSSATSMILRKGFLIPPCLAEALEHENLNLWAPFHEQHSQELDIEDRGLINLWDVISWEG